MNGNEQFLGIVKLGKFSILTPGRLAGSSARLTGIPMQAAVAPESREINLSQYEERALLIRGHCSGDWIYSAEVVDQAGPILTAVVQQIFGQGSEDN